MRSFALVAPVVLGVGVWLVRRTSGRAGAPSLGSLSTPLASLLMLAPVPAVALAFGSWFEGVANGNAVRTVEAVRTVAQGLVLPLWYGSAGALLLLVTALALDWLLVRMTPVESPAASMAGSGSSSWFVAVMPLSVLVTTAFVYLVAGVGPILVEAAREFIPADPAVNTSERGAEFAAPLAARIILGVVGGGALAVLVAAMTALLTLTASRVVMSPRHARVARLTTGVAVASLVALVLRLGTWLYGGEV